MNRLEQIEKEKIKRIENLLAITHDPSTLIAQELRNVKRLKFKVEGINLMFRIGGKEVWNDEYFHPESKADKKSEVWANHMLDFAIAGNPPGNLL